jgi:hypothetical protein
MIYARERRRTACDKRTIALNVTAERVAADARVTPSPGERHEEPATGLEGVKARSACRPVIPRDQGLTGWTVRFCRKFAFIGIEQDRIRASSCGLAACSSH